MYIACSPGCYYCGVSMLISKAHGDTALLRLVNDESSTPMVWFVLSGALYQYYHAHSVCITGSGFYSGAIGFVDLRVFRYPTYPTESYLSTNLPTCIQASTPAEDQNDHITLPTYILDRRVDGPTYRYHTFICKRRGAAAKAVQFQGCKVRWVVSAIGREEGPLRPYPYEKGKCFFCKFRSRGWGWSLAFCLSFSFFYHFLLLSSSSQTKPGQFWAPPPFSWLVLVDACLYAPQTAYLSCLLH
ncbi:hypothetical protein B0T17DRAFT_259889 [Bombardia bombarda]|uniref:Uncharacterized protein n=1 Tax=Bombardia bombarda TaxID=252184 RepID=A0AA39X0K8_9PEZI|nr:hypothetical protein B0T17DRAFT_259889 [Bombardia bombarda]